MNEQKLESLPCRPYGTALGLLIASGVTLIGILREVSPEVILTRAVVAGWGCGLMTRLLVSLLK